MQLSPVGMILIICIYICYKMSFHADCGDAPPAPANGTRSGSSTTVGSIVTYTCNHGFSPSAQGHYGTTIACMANGSWNGSAPQCFGKLTCKL